MVKAEGGKAASETQGESGISANQGIIYLDNTLHSSPVSPELEAEIKKDQRARGIGMKLARRWLAGEDLGFKFY